MNFMLIFVIVMCIMIFIFSIKLIRLKKKKEDKICSFFVHYDFDDINLKICELDKDYVDCEGQNYKKCPKFIRFNNPIVF